MLKKHVLASKLSHVVFIRLINVKMPTILTFMSMIDFMLNWAEQEKSYITSMPEKYTTNKRFPSFIYHEWAGNQLKVQVGMCVWQRLKSVCTSSQCDQCLSFQPAAQAGLSLCWAHMPTWPLLDTGPFQVKNRKWSCSLQHLIWAPAGKCWPCMMFPCVATFPYGVLGDCTDSWSLPSLLLLKLSNNNFFLL